MNEAIAIVILGLTFCIPAAAQTTSGSSAGALVATCETSASTIGDLKKVGVNEGLCIGMFSGWRDVIDALPVFTSDRHSQIHIVQSATNGQLMRVYVAYVKAHPEVENKDEFVVFVWALKDAGLLTEEGKRGG
jgi:hypothetical protein